MLLYRIQSKCDGCGPLSSFDRFPECVQIKSHTDPMNMNLSRKVRKAVDGGEFFYFFRSLDTLCDIMGIHHPSVPDSKGYCRWVENWQIVTCNTVDLVEHVDYHTLDDEQVIVHSMFSNTFKELSNDY